MRTYTVEEVKKIMISAASDYHPNDAHLDEEGQIIIQTYIYRWSDKSLHDVAESNYCGAV